MLNNSFSVENPSLAVPFQPFNFLEMYAAICSFILERAIVTYSFAWLKYTLVKSAPSST